jgi:hypothetical protein
MLIHHPKWPWMQRVSCDGAENTAAQLSVCTNKEQRMVIHFLLAEGVNRIEIHVHSYAIP